MANPTPSEALDADGRVNLAWFVQTYCADDPQYADYMRCCAALDDVCPYIENGKLSADPRWSALLLEGEALQARGSV